MHIHACFQVYKAYPLSLKKAIEEDGSLHANRKGIVPLHSNSDKPTVTPSELIQFRRLGLSYKQIGKKLGVDPHKEDVLQVYHAIRDSTGLNVEDVPGPSKVSPTNPLWYTFESERDVIASSIVPGKDDLLNLRPQQRIKERLGEHAGFKLAAYLEVQEIVHEEIVSAINGASVKSQVGQLKQWVGDLPISVCKSVFSIEQAVGHQAFQLSEYWEEGQGRCRCSAVKVIRFGWKLSPIPYPSFFGGCSRYTPQDAYSHDKGIPIKKSCWNILDPDSETRGKSAHISDKELDRLATKFNLVHEYWADRSDEDAEGMLKYASAYYGALQEDLPLTNIESVYKTIDKLRFEIQGLRDERVAAIVRDT